jgi:hypothetical protein
VYILILFYLSLPLSFHLSRAASSSSLTNLPETNLDLQTGNKQMTSELEERYQELIKSYNVQGCLLLTAEGAVIKTNLVQILIQTKIHFDCTYIQSITILVFEPLQDQGQFYKTSKAFGRCKIKCPNSRLCL